MTKALYSMGVNERNAMPQYCKLTRRQTIACHTALETCAKWFGMDEAAVAAKCGRYVRGANAGKVRGWIVWLKCEVGGWLRAVEGVVKPGMVFAVFCPTWDEMGQIGRLDLDRFLASAKRVDDCYGYDWRAQEERRAEQVEVLMWREAWRRAVRQVNDKRYEAIGIASHGLRTATTDGEREAWRAVLRHPDINAEIVIEQIEGTAAA